MVNGNLGFGVRGFNETAEEIQEIGEELRGKSRRAAKRIRKKSRKALRDI